MLHSLGPWHMSGPGQMPGGLLTANIREFTNDDDDGNENGKKAVGLDKLNNNFARASRFFFLHFSAVVARLQRETA